MKRKLQTNQETKRDLFYLYKYGMIGIDYIFCCDKKKEY